MTPLEWLALPAYIMLFLWNVVSPRGRMDKYEQAFYDHLVANSGVYPRGPWQAIFGIVWAILYSALGVAGFLYWFFSDPTSILFHLGLAFHFIGLFFNLAWYPLFFQHRILWLAFVDIIIVIALAVGVIICSAIGGRIPELIIYCVYVAWLIYATVMTGVATFAVPTYEEKEKMP